MSTFIELYLLTYFLLLLLCSLALKKFLKTKASCLAMVANSVMFAIIKFLLDFYYVALVYQTIVITLYVLVSNLIVHKLNHVSKLVVSTFLFALYYLCLAGIKHLFTNVCNITGENNLNNFHLILLLGFNFIIFALSCAVIEYLKLKNPVNLTRKCFLLINSRKIGLTGFLDTGNSLKEPKTGKGVVIISLNSLKKHLTDKMYADLVFATNASGAFADISRIKFNTIQGSGQLTVFKPNKFVVEGSNIDCYVGVTIKQMQYDVLLNNEIRGG